MLLALYFFAIQALTIFLYWSDKRAARNGAPRVPETTLLLAGFMGGTLAALFAMGRFRHKTRKTSFQIKFWALTALQLYLLLFPPPALRGLLLKIVAIH